MHKLHIAEWHGAEFERLEGELTTADFFDSDTQRFLPAQAQAWAWCWRHGSFAETRSRQTRHYCQARPSRLVASSSMASAVSRPASS
jgi:hypothetical protein